MILHFFKFASHNECVFVSYSWKKIYSSLSNYIPRILISNTYNKNEAFLKVNFTVLVHKTY